MDKKLKKAEDNLKLKYKEAKEIAEANEEKRDGNRPKEELLGCCHLFKSV